jgi:hypothetical protein
MWHLPAASPARAHARTGLTIRIDPTGAPDLGVVNGSELPSSVLVERHQLR